MKILGAGMGGCIAAILNGNAEVLEASETPPTNHKAVLRFRTDQISKVTGIPFKRVRVHKGIFFNRQLVPECNINLSNLYSQKVTGGKIVDRSIWNLDPVDRFVAPSNFHAIMLSMLGSRVKYGQDVIGISSNEIILKDNKSIYRHEEPVISTIPMPELIGRLTSFGNDLSPEEFQMQPIVTVRMEIPNCNVNQTIYFPGPETPLYRATITGGTLILEFAAEGAMAHVDLAATQAFVQLAFGFELPEFLWEIAPVVQRYGKISPINESKRKQFMFEASRVFGIYSLGRFATWRNVLLDDVYKDVLVIRSMIEQSHYDLLKGINQNG